MPGRQYGAFSPPGTPGTPASTRTFSLPTKPGHKGIASIHSSVVNLANTIIGAGALAFPSAFAAMGLMPGVISCLFSGLTSIFGLYLLSRCAAVVGTAPGDEGKKASFSEVARITFGKGWAMRLFDLAIAIKCFGVSVSYLIICKTLLPQVCVSIARAAHHTIPADSLLLSPDFWLCVTMLVIVPLSFLRTLDALRFTSQIALLTVVYLIIVVVGWFTIKGSSPDRGEIVLWKFGTSTLSSFPVQVFAYTCAQNLFPIYNELKNPTQARMNVVIFSSIGLGAACYEVLGIIGYLTFGGKVGSNIIAMYPPTSLTIAVGRFGIVLLVGLSYPLQCLPCRACLHGLTRGIWKRYAPARLASAPVTPARNDPQNHLRTPRAHEQSPLVPKPPRPTEKRGGDMTQRKFVFLTTVILVSGFLVALAVDELEVVLGFVGSTGSTIISFILPGFFYFKLFRAEEGMTKWAALALGIYGLLVMTFCLTFNIIKLVAGHAPVGLF
ncbi:hypothetical protein EHS25_001247 [Saitozyma podzolica]|uniref:Amino acid transporter transmembrane domain-containing protein n=1 Tax=Saitozyma podzolica TaxID=1890683 RepID=A0A427YHU0_9TREE|nr:hypothetical protein EHS25_001247 [Saitozyma podzolica]